MLVFAYFILKIAVHSPDCGFLLMIGLLSSAVDALDIFLAIVAVLGTRSLGRAITMPDARLAVPARRHALKKAPLQHLRPHDKTIPLCHAHVFPARLSVSFLLPLLLGKLTGAAARGEPAMTTLPEIPLLTLPGHHNLINVDVDGIAVTAPIDTGAHISVMNSNLHTHLEKVLTPAPLAVVRVANGGTPAVTGMCAARVTVAGHHTSVLFYVLEQCPHEIILGLDFL